MHDMNYGWDAKKNVIKLNKSRRYGDVCAQEQCFPIAFYMENVQNGSDMTAEKNATAEAACPTNTHTYRCGD